jgi:hypothetical protein
MKVMVNIIISFYLIFGVVLEGNSFTSVCTSQITKLMSACCKTEGKRACCRTQDDFCKCKISNSNTDHIPLVISLNNLDAKYKLLRTPNIENHVCAPVYTNILVLFSLNVPSLYNFQQAIPLLI